MFPSAGKSPSTEPVTWNRNGRPSWIADIERQASGETEAICCGEKLLITPEAALHIMQAP
jgi:hypothetical protein